MARSPEVTVPALMATCAMSPAVFTGVAPVEVGIIWGPPVLPRAVGRLVRRRQG